MNLGFRTACCVIALSSAASSQVVISEILYDPIGTDNGQERIEIHNPGTSAEDLSRWSICLNHPDDSRYYYAFASGRSLAAGSYLTVHWRASGTPDASNVYTGSEGSFLFGLGSARINNTTFALSLYKDNNATWGGSEFTNSARIRDFVQVGGPDLLRETVAIGAGIWDNNDFILDVAEGTSLVYVGSGETSADFFGDPGGYVLGDNGLTMNGARSIGSGCAGTSGHVPQLGPTHGFPADTGAPWQISLTKGRGGRLAFLVVGSGEDSIPFAGCTLSVTPTQFLGPFVQQNSGAGQGTLQFGIIADPSFAGADLFLTAILADDGGPTGKYTVSNGIELNF